MQTLPQTSIHNQGEDEEIAELKKHLQYYENYKVRGLLRNGKGMTMFGNIMTAIMTWKLRGLNPLEEVRKYLSRLGRYKLL